MSAGVSHSRSSSQYRIFTRNRFRFAPVSKFWCGCTLFGSCALIPFHNLKWHFVLSYPAIIQGKQLWKVMSSKLFFLDFQGIISGCLLIYYMRIIERRFGSRKYANFLLLCSLTSLCLEILLFSLIKEFDVIEVPFFASGPYSVLFSCMIQFILDVPFVPYGRIMNIPLSGKLLPYLLALQLCFVSPRVALGCVSGMVSGLVYRWDYFYPKHWCLIPNSVWELGGWIFKPLADIGEDKKGRILPFGATIEAQRQELMDRFEQRLIFEQMRNQHAQDGAGGLPFIQRLFGHNPVVEARLPPVQVSESNVQILMDMGFTDRNTVVEALQGCNNDVSSAANFLLHNSS